MAAAAESIHAEYEFIGFDFETNSIDTQVLNPIMQAAFIKKNLNTGEVKEFVLDGRLGMHYANPIATSVHGISPDRKEALSQHQIAHKIYAAISRAKDIPLAGYNNQVFDNNVMRQAFFSAGLPPYEAESREPSVDIYKLAIMSMDRGGDTLKFMKKDDGRPSLSLESIVRANNFGFEKMHDAREDVFATLAVIDHVQATDPGLWDEFRKNSKVDHILSLLGKGEPVSTLTHARNGIAESVALPIGQVNARRNDYIAVKLNDPKRLVKLLGLDADQIKGMFALPPGDRPTGFKSKTASNIPLRVIKAGSQPVIFETKGRHQDKQELIDESLQIIEEYGREAAAEKLKSAYEDGVYYEDKPNPQARLYSTSTALDERTILTRMGTPGEDGLPQAVRESIMKKISHFEADHETHLGLMTAIKYDALFDKALDEGGDFKAVVEEQLKAVGENAKYELVAYRNLLTSRFGFDNELLDEPSFKPSVELSEKWSKEIEKMKEKDHLEEKVDSEPVAQAFEHNKKLAVGVNQIFELAREYEQTLKLPLEKAIRRFAIRPKHELSPM